MEHQDPLLSAPLLQMEWQVNCDAVRIAQCYNNTHLILTILVTNMDYSGIEVLLSFGVGDRRVCHDIDIIDDNICEVEPIEDFSVILQYVSGDQPIIIDPANTHITINDNAESECGKMIMSCICA